MRKHAGMALNLIEVQCRKLLVHEVDDFVALIRVFGDVFEMKDLAIPTENYLKELLQRNDFMAFVASANSEIVGGLTCYVLNQYYSTKPLAYIYDLAVKTDFQRQGTGRKLISAVKEYCGGNGFEEVFVQADEVDDYALEFYRSTGITKEEKVRHFYYTLPGQK